MNTSEQAQKKYVKINGANIDILLVNRIETATSLIFYPPELKNRIEKIPED